jgi:hypothetical protein
MHRTYMADQAGWGVAVTVSIGGNRRRGAALTRLIPHHPYLARVKSNGEGARNTGHGTE